MKSTDRPDKKQPKGDYEVGYCKPPVAHQFKHGNKANPKGAERDRRVARS